jgi:hypothetical protein
MGSRIIKPPPILQCDFTQLYIASASASSSRAKLFWHANINTQSSLALCFSSHPTKVLAPPLVVPSSNDNNTLCARWFCEPTTRSPDCTQMHSRVHIRRIIIIVWLFHLAKLPKTTALGIFGPLCHFIPDPGCSCQSKKLIHSCAQK